jgi:hypothetical protein
MRVMILTSNSIGCDVSIATGTISLAFWRGERGPKGVHTCLLVCWVVTN